MDWGWPASTLLEKKPSIICNKPPYASNSFTSEELTATGTATYNPASPASSVTIPYVQSMSSFASDLSSNPIPRTTLALSFLGSSTGLSATQTYMYCATDSQCTEACEIGYSNRCELCSVIHFITHVFYIIDDATSATISTAAASYSEL